MHPPFVINSGESVTVAVELSEKTMTYVNGKEALSVKKLAE
jgi:hypothetical protein